ncbi:unnamed protein product [Angiostrongylus costaricensis]|uniref:Uncharacterized protein n=1 Tax=Angiostrongylus costaricensis TaxID=334426 RepID=A0A0R3PBD2_ANGCS|nr:unnamed protein product [Angiostrongylus costaricensis]
MSSLPSSSSETGHRNVHKWYFTKEEAANTASIRDGFTPEKELTYRQQATRFIQMMVDQLNHNVRDQRGKMWFFGFTTVCFPLDIAAACLFLAGKSEECPRKLDHIVRVWWAKKFDRHPTIPSNNVRFLLYIKFTQHPLNNKKLTESISLFFFVFEEERRRGNCFTSFLLHFCFSDVYTIHLRIFLVNKKQSSNFSFCFLFLNGFMFYMNLQGKGFVTPRPRVRMISCLT